MARTGSELTKLLLVACDMSYAADDPALGFVGSPLQAYQDTENYNIPVPFSIPSGFVVDKLFVDAPSGFKAIAFRGQSDLIIAFGGTDGNNLQDWKENLKFGWSQWIRNSESIFSYLDQLRAPDGVSPFNGKVHFTGQSLGGGLAEYAAYEFLARADNQTAIDALKARITVTTFNGFGGAAILAQERADFRPDMLANLSESATYYIANDIISRLGFSHIGIPEYLLDYRAETKDPVTGLRYFLDPFDAHRIEPGFYGNYSPVLGFDESINLRSAKIIIPGVQQAAALWAGIFSDKTSAPGDAIWRLPAGIIGGLLTGPTGEVQELSREVVAAFEQAGGFSAPSIKAGAQVAKRKIYSLLGEHSPLVLLKLSTPQMYSAVAGLFAVALGANADQRAAISDGFKQVLGVELTIATVPDVELLMQSRLALAGIPGVLDEDVDASKVFTGLDFDLTTYAETIFSGSPKWLDNTLAYLSNRGFQSHADAATRVTFEAALIDYVHREMEFIDGSSDSNFQDKVLVALDDFATSLAQAIANTNADFTNKYVLADATLFGATQFDFIGFDQYHDSLEETRLNPEFASVRAILDESLHIIESAGQTLVASAGDLSVNPFDGPAFDPEVSPILEAHVQEGGITRFTLSLPYAAGDDGQQVVITLDGTAATNVSLLAAGEEVLPQDGVYAVTIASGDREVEVSLWGKLDITEPGVSEPGTLSMSTTLVDSNGQATHETHLEANLEFVTRPDFDLQERVPTVFSDANDVLLIQAPLTGEHFDGGGGDDVFWGDTGPDRFLGGTGNDRLFGSFRLYDRHDDSDWLSGGEGDDQLLGGEGDDLLEGDAGSDVVLGDVGNDFLFGGSQADYAMIFTAGGLDFSPDLVQGGVGDDLLVGSGGNDRLSGGNDADIVMGGAGNDEIRGDTEFVPTHMFQIIGSTFPPQQPFAGGADVLYGNAGNDILFGESGDDRLYGGEGSDRLTGGEGKDELYGGTGDDLLEGDADSLDPLVHTGDLLHGGEGNDYLRGQGGIDILIGDAGDDLLEGGHEADIYIFNRGDGVDTILDDGSNTLRFGPGIYANDLRLGLGSLYIQIGGSSDAIRIENFDADDVLGTYAIDSFEFLDGTRLTYEDLVARGFDLNGTEEDDFIRGTSVTDRITGAEGNDELDGGEGIDVMNGGPGDDIYYVDDPSDVIHENEGEGTDTVLSTAASYRLGLNLENLELIQIEHESDDQEDEEEGEDSSESVTITGGIAGIGNELDNEIVGNALDNVLDGGPGNDQLIGDMGSDTYVFGRGSGADTIIELDDAAGETDSIQLGPNISPTDIGVLREGNDIVVAIRDTADRVLIRDWFVSDSARIESTIFAGGTVWDAAMLESLATTTGNAAPVVGNAIVDQTASEDATFSFTIPGDTFVDANDGDTLIFDATRADGSPLPTWVSFDAAAREFSGMPGNDDVGAFEIMVTATDSGGLSVSDAFTLTVESTNDSPVLLNPLSKQVGNQNAPLEFGVPAGSFDDIDAGDVLTFAAALADGHALPAWLDFDAANQTFSGMPGERDAGLYLMSVEATDSTGTSITGGFELSISDAAATFASYHGTKRRDVIPTGFENDFIDTGKGDDWISSGAGRDLVLAGKDDDRVYGGYGNDYLLGGKGKDYLYGQSGSDVLFGEHGDDHLDGGEGNDVLDGGKGKDNLIAGAGNNLLVGGPGSDVLYGGSAHDVFLFNLGDGKATLHLEGAAIPGNTDTISLDKGIAPDDIVLRRKGKDLIVSATGSDDDDDDNEGAVRIALENWYESGSEHRTVTRLQLIDDSVEIYDFTALAARYDVAVGGRDRQWRPGDAMSDALLSNSTTEAIGGALAYQYATQGTIAHVPTAVIQETLADSLFGEGPQLIVDHDGPTLAAFLAGGEEEDGGIEDFFALVSDPGVIDGPVPFTPGGTDGVLTPPQSERKGRHNGDDSDNNDLMESLVERWFGGDQDGSRSLIRFLDEHDAWRKEHRNAGRNDHHLTQDEVAACWRRTQRLLEAHLANQDPAALAGGEDHGFSPGLSGGGYSQSVLSGDRLPRVAGHQLRRLEGLDEGLTKLYT